MKAKRFAALLLAAAMMLLLTACGGEKVTITPTAAKSVEIEKYETADFSLNIPKGWQVTYGGTNIYHSIRVYDPSEPRNQMFVLLKADVLLHSQAGKEELRPGQLAGVSFHQGGGAGESVHRGLFQDFPAVCGLCVRGGAGLFRL